MVREKELRASLEESHSSLLQRVSDMERIVESERGDVQTLAQDCKTLRKEAVTAREECERAQRLKGQLEALVTQLQEDAGILIVLNLYFFLTIFLGAIEVMGNDIIITWYKFTIIINMCLK